MAKNKIKAKIKRSSLYTFACARHNNKKNQPHSVDGPGFSRIVHCNDPDMHRKHPLKYRKNYISTTRYNVITFVPKAFFEQFRRVANIYFLVAALCSLFSISPFSPVSMIAPLAFVLGVSMAKEAIEDWNRFVFVMN